MIITFVGVKGKLDVITIRRYCTSRTLLALLGNRECVLEKRTNGYMLRAG